MTGNLVNRVLGHGFHRHYNTIGCASLVFGTLYGESSIAKKMPLKKEEVFPEDKSHHQIVSYISTCYKTVLISGMKSLQTFFSCYEVTLSKDIVLGFSFYTAKKLNLKKRFLNVQYLIKEKRGSGNAITELVKFVRFLENCPDNEIEMILFKLNDIDGEMLERPTLVTADSDRLNKVYKRMLKSKPIQNSECYSIEYNPKFPKQLYNELQ
jgi:hypothetical protein